ncbi:MAG: site-2 protease family protein [Burkholderiales bacterium]
MEEIIKNIAIYAIPVIFAVTVHEAAHGYVAKYFGDPTAYMLGRVTLNPVKHIDPIGTIALPLLLLLVSSGGMLFGYAKPVPVNFSQLRQPKADMLWVAAAGPAANLLMLIIWAFLYKIALMDGVGDFSEPLGLIARAGILINASLMVLNLLPILPLDGGRIAVSLLPMSLARPFAQLEQYGMFIVMGLLITGVLTRIMGPLMEIVLNITSNLFGI